jgi:hypothetical protein
VHHGEKTHRVSGSSLGLSLERCSHYGGTHYGRESGVKRTTAQYIPIAAFTANGDLEKLRTALSAGLDAGLTVNEIKEILVQMYTTWKVMSQISDTLKNSCFEIKGLRKQH